MQAKFQTKSNLDWIFEKYWINSCLDWKLHHGYLLLCKDHDLIFWSSITLRREALEWEKFYTQSFKEEANDITKEYVPIKIYSYNFELLVVNFFVLVLRQYLDCLFVFLCVFFLFLYFYDFLFSFCLALVFGPGMYSSFVWQ